MALAGSCCQRDVHEISSGEDRGSWELVRRAFEPQDTQLLLHSVDKEATDLSRTALELLCKTVISDRATTHRQRLFRPMENEWLEGKVAASFLDAGSGFLEELELSLARDASILAMGTEIAVSYVAHLLLSNLLSLPTPSEDDWDAYFNKQDNEAPDPSLKTKKSTFAFMSKSSKSGSSSAEETGLVAFTVSIGGCQQFPPNAIRRVVRDLQLLAEWASHWHKRIECANKLGPVTCALRAFSVVIAKFLTAPWPPSLDMQADNDPHHPQDVVNPSRATAQKRSSMSQLAFMRPLRGKITHGVSSAKVSSAHEIDKSVPESIAAAALRGSLAFSDDEEDEEEDEEGNEEERERGGCEGEAEDLAEAREGGTKLGGRALESGGENLTENDRSRGSIDSMQIREAVLSTFLDAVSSIGMDFAPHLYDLLRHCVSLRPSLADAQQLGALPVKEARSTLADCSAVLRQLRPYALSQVGRAEQGSFVWTDEGNGKLGPEHVVDPMQPAVKQCLQNLLRKMCPSAGIQHLSGDPWCPVIPHDRTEAVAVRRLALEAIKVYCGPVHEGYLVLFYPTPDKCQATPAEDQAAAPRSGIQGSKIDQEQLAGSGSGGSSPEGGGTGASSSLFTFPEAQRTPQELRNSTRSEGTGTGAPVLDPVTPIRRQSQMLVDYLTPTPPPPPPPSVS